MAYGQIGSKYHDIALYVSSLGEYLVGTEDKAAPISVEGVSFRNPQTSVLVSLHSRRSDHLLLPVKSGTISD